MILLIDYDEADAVAGIFSGTVQAQGLGFGLKTFCSASGRIPNENIVIGVGSGWTWTASSTGSTLWPLTKLTSPSSSVRQEETLRTVLGP